MLILGDKHNLIGNKGMQHSMRKTRMLIRKKWRESPVMSKLDEIMKERMEHHRRLHRQYKAKIRHMRCKQHRRMHKLSYNRFV